MKAVVTLSKKFFPKHFRAGEETEFKKKVLAGSKLHTCRGNYEYWAKKVAKIQETGGILSVRQWSEKPYRSPQEIVVEVPGEVVGIQKLELRRKQIAADHYEYNAEVDGCPVSLEMLAANDGLTIEEYKAWFAPVFNSAMKKYPALTQVSKAIILDFAIIHFTKQKYEYAK